MKNWKDKFFSILAHDLRGPFNSFFGLTQIMASELPKLTLSEIQKIANSMRNSATSLFYLLENLLQWSRNQQGLIFVTPEKIQLLQVTDESIAIMTEPAKIKEIIIDVRIPGEMMVRADEMLLQTVIRNLVSNAVKFTPKGGKITIFAEEKASEMVVISFRDTGIGMKTEVLQRLFEFNNKASRQGTEGEPSTGLGLLLCKEFIEKLGGTLRAESEDGKGSTFSISLPSVRKS